MKPIYVDPERKIASENGSDNQNCFDDNKEYFSKQCRIVYDALRRGEKLTTSEALLQYKIGDLRRRIKDLKDLWNVPVQSQYIAGKYKEYYL